MTVPLGGAGGFALTCQNTSAARIERGRAIKLDVTQDVIRTVSGAHGGMPEPIVPVTGFAAATDYPIGVLQRPLEAGVGTYPNGYHPVAPMISFGAVVVEGDSAVQKGEALEMNADGTFDTKATQAAFAVALEDARQYNAEWFDYGVTGLYYALAWISMGFSGNSDGTITAFYIGGVQATD